MHTVKFIIHEKLTKESILATWKIQKLIWEKNTWLKQLTHKKQTMAKTAYGKICPWLKSDRRTKFSKQNLLSIKFDPGQLDLVEVKVMKENS